MLKELFQQGSKLRCRPGCIIPPLRVQITISDKNKMQRKTHASLPGAYCRVFDTVQVDTAPLENQIQFYTMPLCYFRILWYLVEVPKPPLAGTNEVR